MRNCRLLASALLTSAGLGMCLPAQAQSFRVQCPNKTNLHPNVQQVDSQGNVIPDPQNPGFIKCQHIAGSDGFATMADGHQIYLFGFAPLSGLTDIQQGLPGTQLASDFDKPYAGPIVADGSSTTSPAGGSADAAIREPAVMMNMGVLAAQAPAPLIAMDEDDELYLTLSNVGMIMRPDLFEQHTVHFHGYPNASSYFDGVPDASVAINIAGSFTYYYTAPDAGTYFWHCHITPPEHLQMGMVGQLFVRPRQNRAGNTDHLLTWQQQNYYSKQFPLNPVSLQNDPCVNDVLCSTPIPADTTDPVRETGVKYAYNDGDGSTAYDVEYPIQMMGFDPNFHFIGMTFNPEPFAEMKDKYFLLNGRSYPDTVNTATLATAASDGVSRPSQPLPTVITLYSCSSANSGCSGKTHRALLRISDLSVTEFSTLATIGIPMKVIGFHARMLRDEAGHNLYYNTNSITIGGGESIDVILDSADVPAGTYYLYSTNLDHLSNDAENFGGMMTEIRIL
jgi:hypothetical protein